MLQLVEKRAPAKINLSLHILGRRADGFHEVATRMTPLGLADVVRVERWNAGAEGALELICTDPTLPTGSGNLAVRAAEVLGELCGPLPALRIFLTKNIPHGAGLGGGSSDAAAVLWAVNELLDLNLSLEKLSEIGGQLGSDVPFFLHGCTCDCTGRGEKITPVPSFRLDWPVLLIKLPFPVPTPWAYQRWAQSAVVPGIDYRPQLLGKLELVNDLERPVYEKHLILAALKMWLLEQPEVAGALMSGSGSTIFALLRDAACLAGMREKVKSFVGDEVWLWPSD